MARRGAVITFGAPFGAFDLRRLPTLAVVLVAVALVAVFVILIFDTTKFDRSQNGVDGQSMRACVEANKALLGQTVIHYNDLISLDFFCYDLNGNQLRIDEEIIKRDNYIFQRNENVVLLYMVVLITFCGVFLAGMQLLASYRLATAGKGELAGGAEITYNSQGASFKSSVVGLSILAMSFAFFLVFVLYVYTFRNDDRDRGNTSQRAPAVATEPSASPPPQAQGSSPRQ